MISTKSKFVGFILMALCLLATAVESRALPRIALHSQAQDQTNARDEKISRLATQGVAALERNDTETARSFFQQILAIAPNNALARTYLGVMADRAGDFKEAERQFAAAAAADPDSPSARNNLGAILVKLGRSKQAAAQFEASLRLDKNQPNALANLAQIRSSGGSPEDLRAARELFARAYAIAPDLEIARALVVIALRLDDREAAARHYRDYAAQLAGANNQAITEPARAELGAALSEAGLFKEAAMELNAAVNLNPSNTETVMRLARAYLALKDIPAAGRALESAVARGYDSAPLYALLASVYEQSGHVENAIPAMRLAIERDPQSEQYRFLYGMLLTNSLAPKAAVIRLEEAIKLFPNSARLWLALGIAHFKGGINDQAATAFLRSIELDKNFAPAFAYLGMTNVEIGQYDEAIKRYEQALAINEKLGVVEYLIADVLLRQTTADVARTEAHLVRAVKLEPTFAPARLALGKLYSRTNRLNEAAAEFEQVVKLDPELAEAYYQLGRAYTRLKRSSEAQATLATFKRLSESKKEQEQNDRREIVRRLANVRF